MTKTAENFADPAAPAPAPIDVLSDVLSTLRVSGSVLVRETYRCPWAIELPRADTMCELFPLPRSARVVAFHLVEDGRCEVRPAKRPALTLGPGDLIFCFAGGEHTIDWGGFDAPLPLATMLQDRSVLQTSPGLDHRRTSKPCDDSEPGKNEPT